MSFVARAQLPSLSVWRWLRLQWPDLSGGTRNDPVRDVFAVSTGMGDSNA